MARLFIVFAFLLTFSFFTLSTTPAHADEAIFAGGCFWCMESDMEAVKGVEGAESGYTGGHVAKPTYKQVSHGGTGHRESVRVVYDPKKVSYKDLLTAYWHNIDPFNDKGQFCDYGEQYTAAIFYENDKQKELAEASLKKVEKRFGKKVATKILPAAEFYPAEEYHQDYYKKNPWKYKFYRGGCGRDARLQEVWGKDAGGHH